MYSVGKLALKDSFTGSADSTRELAVVTTENVSISS